MKRFIDTELDDREWFMKLSCKLKCAVGYLFRKCDNAGIWEPNYILAQTYIGEAVTEAEILGIDGGKQFEKIPAGKIFVVGFCDFQYGKLTEECKPHRPVIAKLKKFGLYERVLIGFQKGIETVQEKDMEKEEETEDRGVGEGFSEGIVPDMVGLFKLSNPAYPVDQLTDYPATRCIAQKIAKWESLKGDITLPGNRNSISRRWGEMVVFIAAHDHYQEYSLTRINKHFQSIAQSFSNGGTKTNRSTFTPKPGTSEARTATAKEWGLGGGE